jgi:hypothetical protein
MRMSGTAIAVSGLLLAGGAAALSQPHQAVANVNANSTALTYTPLTLVNGWKGGPFNTRKPAVAKDANGVIHFKGAMTNSTNNNPVAFTLPAAFRPPNAVFLPVDEANATVGRIDILPNGTVTVEAETSFANARTFTSLDGVTFAG